jgi:hypothetical protein
MGKSVAYSPPEKVFRHPMCSIAARPAFGAAMKEKLFRDHGIAFDQGRAGEFHSGGRT